MRNLYRQTKSREAVAGVRDQRFCGGDFPPPEATELIRSTVIHMTFKAATSLAAALAVCMLATPAVANGDGYKGYNGYGYGYQPHRSYKHAARPYYVPQRQDYQVPQPLRPQASVVYERPVARYTYPAYSYSYAYPVSSYVYSDCRCRRYRRRHRRCR